jgi:hypothetical protein
MQTGLRVNAGRWLLILSLSFAVLGYGEDLTGQESGWKADLKRMGFDVPVEELEKGEIVGQKWLAGGARPGFLGAKVFFIVSANPEKVAPLILNLDPTGGKELAWEEGGTVKMYQKFTRPPTSQTWDRFRSALKKLPFDTLLGVEGKKEGRYHLTPEEIQKITADKVDGWVSVLDNKMQTFARGGWKENPGVPSGPGMMVDFDSELRDVLKENGPVRDELRRVLTELAYGGRDEKEKIVVNDYWMLMEVDKSPAVALGCGVMRSGLGGRWEVADMQYYVSNGYYGAISIYGIWPYGEGRSLVCRVDGVLTDPGQLAQATARLIGESLFMREVKSGCEIIKTQISNK